jgi:hypothetical protein
MAVSDSHGDCSEASKSENYEKRRIPRVSLGLTARVDVQVDKNVGWSETTRLRDISSFGAGFVLHRPLKRGRLVLMTMPMPRQLRCFDYTEPEYRIWATVRRCIEKPDTNECSVGVAFVGKTPPAGYTDNPSQRYDISYTDIKDGELWRLIPADLVSKESQKPRDDRKHTRLTIAEPLVLQTVDYDGNPCEEESTVAENISLGGAAVLSSLNLAPGTFLRVTNEARKITILSVVRRTRVGENGINRLHIEFVDRHFPLEGIDYTSGRP